MICLLYHVLKMNCRMPDVMTLRPVWISAVWMCVCVFDLTISLLTSAVANIILTSVFFRKIISIIQESVTIIVLTIIFRLRFRKIFGPNLLLLVWPLLYQLFYLGGDCRKYLVKFIIASLIIIVLIIMYSCCRVRVNIICSIFIIERLTIAGSK